MNFGQRQQWPSPPSLSSSGLSLPSAYSLPLPRSRTPTHRLQKTPFPPSRSELSISFLSKLGSVSLNTLPSVVSPCVSSVHLPVFLSLFLWPPPSPSFCAAPHPSFQSLQPLTSPNSTPGSVSNSKPGSTSPISSKDTDPSATLKRNSGGSSGSSSGGGINTTDWRSTTNVYIKGLPEKCTNSDLQLWAEQVANPVSVKTIRDARDHNICTGLGKFCMTSLILFSFVHVSDPFLLLLLFVLCLATPPSTGFVRFSLPAQAKLFIALVNAVEGYEACLAKVSTTP